MNPEDETKTTVDAVLPPPAPQYPPGTIENSTIVPQDLGTTGINTTIQQSPTIPSRHSKKMYLIIAGIVSLFIAVGVWALVSAKENKPANSNEQQAGLTDEQIEDVAKIITQTKDLRWSAPTNMSKDWVNQLQSQSEALYRFKSTTCAAYFRQPDGLTALGITADSKVMDDLIDSLSKEFGETSSTRQITDKDDLVFNTTGKTNTKTIGFLTKEVYFSKNNIKGVAAVHLDGDFVLSVVATCGSDDYKTYGSSVLLPFVTSFKADVID